MVITIDGPAGSGKSTAARLLAEKLHLYQVDSGAFYRFFTYLFLSWQKDKNLPAQEIVNSPEFQNYLSKEIFEVEFKDNKQLIIWKNENMDNYIRTPEITRNIKIIADNTFMRHEVNRRIKVIAEKYSIIADGRDMGTVVFPDAQCKFFLDASLKIRAMRRYSEFQTSNPGISLQEVEKEIDKRDKEDQKREFGKLIPAKDAIFIDTTNLEINGVVNALSSAIQNKKTSS
ncbi:MAG: (d)CMP kinase [Spirochaetia bacterium]|nr:(d)CMP kinase [Spirochaetia bacterium]